MSGSGLSKQTVVPVTPVKTLCILYVNIGNPGSWTIPHEFVPSTKIVIKSPTCGVPVVGEHVPLSKSTHVFPVNPVVPEMYKLEVIVYAELVNAV
jgi:hypothetical protein